MSDIIEKKHTICMWCHNHCEVTVYVKNQYEVVNIEEDKANFYASQVKRNIQGCLRIRAAQEFMNHPDRLNYPLKRAGKKGENKWLQISWDQALNEIAAELSQIKKEYGPEAVATSCGTGRTHDEYRLRFFNLFGSQNIISQSQICFGPSNAVSSLICGGLVYSPVRKNTKVIILWGANPHQASRRYWYNILEAKENGAKLIVIDPRKIYPAQKADLWLQIRPGTDGALAMGLINYLISNQLYDKEFVEKYCYGFEELRQRVFQMSLESVSKITNISIDDIKKVATLYSQNKPGIIFSQMGMEHLHNSIETLHARYILTAITGNIGVEGGELLRKKNINIIGEYETELTELVTPEQKQKQLGADKYKLIAWPGYELLLKEAKKKSVENPQSQNCFAHAPTVYRAMITGNPYPVKALITVSSNPLITQSNTHQVYEALEKLQCYVVMDFWMTPSAMMADYVLPAASWLERPVIWSWWDTLPLVEIGEAPLPNLKANYYERYRDYDFWRGLGIRLGQNEYWPWESLEDAYSFRMAKYGKKFEEIVKKRRFFISNDLNDQNLIFATPTGQVELYSTILESLGLDPLPQYYEPNEGPINQSISKEYPLILITGGRFLPMYHSEHRQIKSLRDKHPNPMVQIHPETAKINDINDGDWIWIETSRGKSRQQATLFDGIGRNVIHMEHGWWFPEMPGNNPELFGIWQSNVNVLTEDKDEYCNPKSGGWPLRTLMCKIYK
jgi:anaerobic selenocysteine-containing dehydrogenase